MADEAAPAPAPQAPQMTPQEALNTGLNAVIELKNSLESTFAGNESLPQMVAAADDALGYLGRLKQLMEAGQQQGNGGAPPAPPTTPQV